MQCVTLRDIRLGHVRLSDQTLETVRTQVAPVFARIVRRLVREQADQAAASDQSRAAGE